VYHFRGQKIFGHTKIFRDIIQIFQISQNNTISHKLDRICPIFLYYKPILPDCETNIVRKIDLALTFCGILFFVCRQIPSFADNLFSGGGVTPPHSRRPCTYVKISHLVASLPTSRQQIVFALLVPSCQQVWNKLLTTCNNLVDIIRLVSRLFQQVQYSHDITILLQPCVVNLVTFLLYHDCIRVVRTTL
jgi:hypothetical protein